MNSALIDQAQRLGLRRRIGKRLDAPRFSQQCLPLAGRDVIEGPAGKVLLATGQHQNQQLVALVPGLSQWRVADGGDGLQRFLPIAAQCVSQRQIAAGIQVGGLKPQASAESGLSGAGLATQNLRDAQPVPGFRLTAGVGGLSQGGDGTLQLALTQLCGAQAKQRVAVVRCQFQCALKGPLSAAQVVAGQQAVAQLQPGLRTGFRLLGSALVKRCGSGRIAALFQVGGQLHGALVAGVGRGRGAARSQRDTTGQQQGRSKAVGHGLGSFAGRRVEAAQTPVAAEGERYLKASAVNSDRYLSPTQVATFRPALRFRHLYAAALLIGSGLMNAAAYAAEKSAPAWFSEPYAYVVVEQDVRGALTELGRNLNLIVVFSDKVRGTSRGSIRAQTAGEFLDRLCDANQLSWYFDGNILHIAGADEVSTRVFDVRGRQLDDLEAYLQHLDVTGEPMSSRPNPDRDGLFVSGPPAYLAQIQQHLDRQPAAEPAPVVRERGVRVFRGGVVTQVSTDQP